ncbi:Glycoside hydrolase 2 Mannanase beta-galactosidase [Binucleata daphniae]
MEEKHLKPHQLAAQQRYTDAKTQPAVPNMSFKDVLPFISIVGPKNSGQNELYTKLVINLTKHEPDNDMTTINTGSKRITIYKSDSNIKTLIDLAKITDLAILTINGNHFEYETFEFIALLKAHGLCKVLICVKFDNIKTKRKNLKNIKKRLWKEIAGGLKIYDVDVDSDINKLVRDIFQMKYRPIEWRCNNSFVVVDKIRFYEGGYDCYGYIRGCVMKSKTVHIPGIGDYKVNIEEQEDPCIVKDRKLLDKERRTFYSPNLFGAKEIKLEKEDSATNESTEEENESFCIYDKITTHSETNYNKENIKKEEPATNIIEREINKQDIQSFVNSKENNKTDILDKLSKENKFTKPNENTKNTIDELKKKLKHKFESKPENEEDFIESFNKKYEDKTIESTKEKRIKQKEKNMKNLQNTNMLVPGKYVKVTIKTDENIEFGNLTILGEITIQNKCLLQGKVKKYNYFPYTLKSNDKYLVSIGWRREYTNVVFSYKDTTRNRFLKYILNGMHCNANFETNMIQPGAPFCIVKEKKYVNEAVKDSKIERYNTECNISKDIPDTNSMCKENTDNINDTNSDECGILQSDDASEQSQIIEYNQDNTANVANNQDESQTTPNTLKGNVPTITNKFFRIAAFGNLTDSSGKTNLVKKLKLIGYPKKINENTVFVKDMFTSDKEVAKFENALIKTVSGIRGCIKKSVGLQGEFRATFEGRVLMSDIIFMRCYIPYEIDNECEQNSKNQRCTEREERNVRQERCASKERDNKEHCNTRQEHNTIEQCNKRQEGNITKMIENKKKRKYEQVCDAIKNKLITEKLKKNEDAIKMPVSPFERHFEEIKEKVEEKRLAK